jgi:hypothetical protein
VSCGRDSIAVDVYSELTLAPVSLSGNKIGDWGSHDVGDNGESSGKNSSSAEEHVGSVVRNMSLRRRVGLQVRRPECAKMAYEFIQKVWDQ